MRALALILTSFLVLAALQASYLVVESKRHQKQQLARVHPGSSNQDRHQDEHQPVTGHQVNKPHQPATPPGIDHKAKHALPSKPMHKVKLFGHWNFENPDHKTSLVHKHHKKGHKGHKKGNKHKDFVHNPLSPSDAKGQQHQKYKPHTELPRYDQIKPAHDKTGHQMATRETIPGTPRPDVPTVNITIERVHGKPIPAHHMDSMHHRMMGDQPAETNTGLKKADKRKKKKKKQVKEQKQRKNKRGKKKKLTENTCTSDTDCKDGQCCVEKKKGRKICKKGHFKHEGKRCLSSCICKNGLECYVSDVNKKGKPKKKKPGKKIMGHCVNPSKVDVNKGHFVTPTATSTVTPTPTQRG